MKKLITALAVVPIVALALSACEVEDATNNRDLSQSPAAKPTTVDKGASAKPPAKPSKPKPQLTSDQENAIDKANQYLGMSAFSRSGLIQQLKYEGFGPRVAAFAVDYIHPDWNVQAAKKAKEYLGMQSFSRSGLMEQLKYEGFSDAQAQYGVNHSYR